MKWRSLYTNTIVKSCWDELEIDRHLTEQVLTIWPQLRRKNQNSTLSMDKLGLNFSKLSWVWIKRTLRKDNIFSNNLNIGQTTKLFGEYLAMIHVNNL